MVNDKFIMFGLDDERSKHIAEVLKNPTCKKILDYLGDVNEASEKDLSDALNMPINTVEYNLNKLIKSGLVEKTKNFFWSVKGKKIPMYKLAKKHIIISPKGKTPDANILRSILPVLLVIIGIAAILLLFNNINNPINQVNNHTDQLKQFSSYEELSQYIKDNTNRGGFLETMADSLGSIGSTNKMAVSQTTTGTPSAEAGSYSTTNIQVEGVDEADFVKNDGKYIYIASDNKIVIVNAYPSESMSIISEINLTGYANNIYVNGDKLIIFLNSGYYYGNSDTGTSILIYNIEERSNPVLENTIEASGYYVESRMIGDYVYLISNKYVNNNGPIVYYSEGVKQEMPISNVYYFDTPYSNYMFSIISSVDVNSGELNSKAYLTDYASSIYVSQNNLFLTYTKYPDQSEYQIGIVKDIFLTILPADKKDKINTLLDSDKTYYEKYSEAQKVVYDYSATLTGNEKQDFDSSLMQKLEDYSKENNKERTVIHKINIEQGEISYITRGDVPGHVLNQFSMDEFNGNFRIATTSGDFWQGESLNNLYVLNKDLNLIGSVDGLAKGEKIYSARFMGERAYIVTFKKVDPLFVIDLSNPSNPEVLGYLKITGYSDYLHPYDETHLIGIGKEAVAAADELIAQRNLDFAWYQGVKVSLFDVSDFNNPKEVAKIEIGDRGTNSDALYDHKAVLFDKEKGILVLPIQLYEVNKSQDNLQDNTYGEFKWQGAYVLNVNTEEITVRGVITHDINKTNEPVSPDTVNGQRIQRYNYPDYQTAIKRSLYMDDNLYTISSYKVKANNLQSINPISEVNWSSYDSGYDYPVLYQ